MKIEMNRPTCRSRKPSKSDIVLEYPSDAANKLARDVSVKTNLKRNRNATSLKYIIPTHMKKGNLHRNKKQTIFSLPANSKQYLHE